MAKCFTVVRSYSINIHRLWLASGRRSFTLDARKFSYEGPGKTTASFLDDEVGQYLMINSINDRGFKLTNGAFAVGPIILFPSFLFRWKIRTIEDITPESLLWFRTIEPRIELIILGIGERNYWPVDSIKILQRNLQLLRKDLKIEMMSTKEAVATYNFMLADFRLVGGAFLPLPSGIEQKLIDA